MNVFPHDKFIWNGSPLPFVASGYKTGDSPLLQGDFIWYSLDPETGFLNRNNTRYINDAGNTIMVGASGSKDGTMYSGRSVTVSGDGVIPVPINATLGDNLNINQLGIVNDDEITNYTNISLTAFNLAVTTAGTNRGRPKVTFSKDDYIIGNKYILQFTCKINSGNTYIRSFDGANTTPFQELVNGVNTIEFIAQVTNTTESFFFDGTQLFDIEITDISTREIQQVQGSVTYFNTSTGAFEQVGADGLGSSKELVVNGDFSDGFNGWNPNTSADFDWAITPDNKLELDLRVNNAFAICPQNLVIPSKSGRVRTEVDVEIISGHSKGASLQLNVNEITHTNLGTGHHVFMDNLNVTQIRCTRAGSIFRGTYDNISVKEALPLAPTYDLKNGTYGTIIVLHTAQFSQDDLAFFNEVPERALQWYWGEIEIPSGLVKGSDDKCYAATEGEVAP